MTTNVIFSGYGNGTALSTINAAWTGSGASSQQVQSGTLSESTPWTSTVAIFPNAQGSNQNSGFFLAAGMANPGAGWTSGPVIHDDGTGVVGYQLLISPTNWQINRANVFQVGGTHGLTWPLAADTGIEIQKSGSVVTAKLNGTTLGSFTDGSPITTGSPGIQLYNNGTSGAVKLVSWTDGALSFAAGVYVTAGYWTAGYSTGESSGTTVAPTKGSLVLTGHTPTLVQTGGGSQTVAPTKGSLTLTGKVPTVTRTANQTVAPTKGALALTGKVPTVTRTANQTVAPSKGSLVLTGKVPTVAQGAGTTLAPAKGALTFTGYAPSVARTANQTVAPAKGTLTLTGKVPIVTQGGGQTIAPSKVSLVLTGKVPTVTRTANQVVAPTKGALALTGKVPTVTRTTGSNQTVAPSKGALTLTGKTPTVTQSANQVISPVKGIYAFTGKFPTLVQSGAPVASAENATNFYRNVASSIYAGRADGPDNNLFIRIARRRRY